MTPEQIARVAVSRLSLPIPLAKVVTIQAIAKALNTQTVEIEAALLGWLRSRGLESESLEGLYPLLLLDREKALPLVQKARTALQRPSIASDLLFSLVTGTIPFVAAWRGKHSGPPPALLDLSSAKGELSEGRVIWPGFREEIERLETEHGAPFMRQWCYEFKELIRASSNRSDGYFEHFYDSNRHQGGALFAFRGHAARSAFLRTLACAVDLWEMPETLAYKLAEMALPADPVLLKIRPQTPPTWVQEAQRQAQGDKVEGADVAGAILREVAAAEQQTLLHCAMTIKDTPDCVVDLQVFAFARLAAHNGVKAADVVSFHEWLVDHVPSVPDKARALECLSYSRDAGDRYGFTPLLTPLLSERVGYMQAELAGRPPFGPASSSEVPRVRLWLDEEGGSFRSSTETIGKFSWWLWGWSPGRRRDDAPAIGCMSSVRHDVAQRLAVAGGGSLAHAWHLKIRTRSQRTYGWSSIERAGFVDG